MTSIPTLMLCCGLAAPTACVALDRPDAHSQADPIAVVEVYERHFRWTDPVPCEVFLHRRITDESARIVEYDARIGEREYSILYSVRSEDSHPLRVDVFEVTGGEGFSLEANEDTVRRLGLDGSLELEVFGYGAGRQHTNVRVVVESDADAARALLGCALPLRGELGAVPQFLRNRGAGGQVPGAPDIVALPGDAPPILEWRGALSFAGVFLREAACTTAGGWSCPCFRWHDPIAGTVDGWCETPTSIAGSVGWTARR